MVISLIEEQKTKYFIFDQDRKMRLTIEVVILPDLFINSSVSYLKVNNATTLVSVCTLVYVNFV